MDGGFVNSPIKLNKLVATAVRWDSTAILARAENLADRAVDIWPVPVVAADVAVMESEAVVDEDELDSLEELEEEIVDEQE